MATSTPKNSNLLTRCLTVNHGLYPSAFISRFDEQKFSAFTIPSAIVSLSSHSTEPDQIPPERSTQGGREGEREGFFVISFVLSMWYDALNIQRERDVSSSSSSFLHLPGKHAQWAETHSDERWFRCTREQREETGRNGVGVRSLSPSLLPPSHSPLLRPGWCMRVAERRGCWRHHFEVRVCFRGKLDIELIFLPSIPLVVD